MSKLKYIRILPTSSIVRRSKLERIGYGIGLLASLAGFMFAVYIIVYTVCMVNGVAID